MSAVEVIRRTFTEPLLKVSGVGEYRGTARASMDPRAIVQAAFQGRVLDLLVAADAEYWGAWNQEIQDVDTGSPEKELLNAASLQTLRHGGNAFVVKASDMPVKAGAAALFRF